MIRLEVRVRNFGTTPALAHLDCYFVASALPHGRRYIWNEVARDVAVPASGELPEQIQSTELTQVTEQRFSSSVNMNPVTGGGPTVSQSASRTTTGAKPYGWIVRLTSGDRLLKVQASSSELETIGRDANAISNLKNVRPTGR